MKVAFRILFVCVVFCGVASAETLEQRMARHRAALQGPRAGHQAVYNDVLETLLAITANPQGNSFDSLLEFHRHFADVMFHHDGIEYAANTLEAFLRRGPFDVQQALILNVLVYLARDRGRADGLAHLLRYLNVGENHEALLWMAGRVLTIPNLPAQSRTHLTNLIFQEVRRRWTDRNQPPEYFGNTPVTQRFGAFADEAERGIQRALAETNTFGFETPHFRAMSFARVLFFSQLMGVEPAALERDWRIAMENADERATGLDRQLERGLSRTPENRHMARWELALPTRPDLHERLHPVMAREPWYLRELFGASHDLARVYFQGVGLPRGGSPLTALRPDCFSTTSDMELNRLLTPFF